MIFTTNIVNKIRQIVEEYLARWPEQLAETGGLPLRALPQPSEDWPGFADAEHDHTEFYDAREIWSRPIAADEPAEGDGLVWDGSQWAIGPVGGGTASAFRAFLTGDTLLTPSTNVTNFGNEHYDVNGDYDNETFKWTPPAGPVAFVARTRLNTNVDIVTAFVKNGTVGFLRSSGRYSVAGSAYTEFAWQDLANGTDYYELAITGDEGTLLASDTFWAGMTGGGGGGAGGGVGPVVPDPFVYLIDTDGVYLLDVDGAYLYEAE